MRWLNVKSGSAIPNQLQLLRLVYVGRMCLAVAIYVTAALKVRVAAAPEGGRADSLHSRRSIQRKVWSGTACSLSG